MNIKKFTRPARKLIKLQRCGAVIVAAGTASRMGGIDKTVVDLGGKPLIRRTVEAFQNCDAIKEIVVVTREDLLVQVMGLCRNMDKVQAVVTGGANRQESVKAGVSALSSKVKLVAIHDGARPMITWEVIDRAVRAANSYGAAAPAIPVKDTIKEARGGVVLSTPDRSRLQAVQTPQVFDKDLLMAAMKKVEQEGAEVTDDCSAVELLGMSVKLVQGDERNLKVTTPLDLKIAKMLLEETK